MADGAEDIARVVPLRPRPSADAGAPPPPQPRTPPPPLVAFHRTELSEILRVYGRMVAAGEWRDYAIDHGREEAVFSVYRHMGEVPQYRIVKTPKNARRQGAYSVVSAQGVILKRGHELATVLRVLDRKRHLSLVGD
jgi:hypothetical protein